MGIHLFDTPYWTLETFFGIQNSFLRINKETVLFTWAVLFFLGIACILCRFFFSRSLIIKNIILVFFQFFIDLTTQTLNFFSEKHCMFVMTLFLFIFLCNILSLIPFLDEPTKDLNTTLALGLISFLYIQWISITTHGLKKYVADYFKPIFIMFPLNILGKLASIMSLSVRLFGNIFGGSIISTLYFSALQFSVFAQILGILTGLNFIIIAFFTLFEGFLQAFVFTMLSLTYISLSIHDEGH